MEAYFDDDIIRQCYSNWVHKTTPVRYVQRTLHISSDETKLQLGPKPVQKTLPIIAVDFADLAKRSSSRSGNILRSTLMTACKPCPPATKHRQLRLQEMGLPIGFKHAQAPKCHPMLTIGQNALFERTQLPKLPPGKSRVEWCKCGTWLIWLRPSSYLQPSPMRILPPLGLGIKPRIWLWRDPKNLKTPCQ